MLPILLVSIDQKQTKSFIKKLQKEQKIDDNFVFYIEPKSKKFSIDQIKEIKKNLSFKINEHRIYILLNFDSATFEAQNAFLKTLEEHNKNIQFIMVVSNYYSLVSTIVSRSKVINIKTDETFKNSEDIFKELGNFIKHKNIKILGSVFFEAKLQKNPVKIIDMIIKYFYENLLKNQDYPIILREAIKYRSYVLFNNVNPQHAIDHILIYIYKKIK